uniref:Uncharacterized protein n=1 Tax=Setaria viridis TaxID=4556 RepID=A0A4V6D1J5_SETVI|nr:hypothetical protein SEVIR_9G327800v2 [Setaria viridis]
MAGGGSRCGWRTTAGDGSRCGWKASTGGGSRCGWRTSAGGGWRFTWIEIEQGVGRLGGAGPVGGVDAEGDGALDAQWAVTGFEAHGLSAAWVRKGGRRQAKLNSEGAAVVGTMQRRRDGAGSERVETVVEEMVQGRRRRDGVGAPPPGMAHGMQGSEFWGENEREKGDLGGESADGGREKGDLGDEFDEEKEPDGIVLAGWSGPVDKQITSNGDKRSVPSSSSADDVDSTAEDASVKPGMKRKLNEILESKENFDALQNKSDIGSSSAQIVEDEDDDIVMFNEDQMQGKKKRLQ